MKRAGSWAANTSLVFPQSYSLAEWIVIGLITPRALWSRGL
jgi:hypothetical protein